MDGNHAGLALGYFIRRLFSMVKRGQTGGTQNRRRV